MGRGNHDFVEERHRHRYEVNLEHVKQLEEAGMAFVGHSTDNTRMEIMELKGEWPCFILMARINTGLSIAGSSGGGNQT